MSRDVAGAGDQGFPPGGVFSEEGAVDQSGGVEVFENAVEEGNITTLGDRVPVVGEIGTEERAIDIGRHPVALHARLEVGVDEDDLGAAFFGQV